MSGHMKKHLTNDDVVILVRGQEIQLKGKVKASLVNIINEIVDFDSYPNEDVYGDWIKDARQRVARYIRGARKRENLTQLEVCKNLDIQQSNYSSIENGKRPVPEQLISKLAKLLNIKSKMITESIVSKKLKAS